MTDREIPEPILATSYQYFCGVFLALLCARACRQANLEGCIASRYMYDEVLGFRTEYFAWYPHIRRQMWDAKEEEIDAGEILIGKEKRKKLTIEELKAIHEYISLRTPQP